MTSQTIEFTTKGGITVLRQSTPDEYKTAIARTLDRVDVRRGAIFSSNYEYPGRYTRWDTAIVDPPLGIEANGRDVAIIAYNSRGEILLAAVAAQLAGHEHIASMVVSTSRIDLRVAEAGKVLAEENRSRSPTVFSVVRAIVDLFFSEEDANLGLYGAFGYDLAFQFDHIEKKLDRPQGQRDLVLYLPDEILVVDHHQAIAWHDHYEYSFGGKTTRGLPHGTADQPFTAAEIDPPRGDHQPGEYSEAG